MEYYIREIEVGIYFLAFDREPKILGEVLEVIFHPVKERIVRQISSFSCIVSHHD